MRGDQQQNSVLWETYRNTEDRIGPCTVATPPMRTRLPIEISPRIQTPHDAVILPPIAPLERSSVITTTTTVNYEQSVRQPGCQCGCRTCERRIQQLIQSNQRLTRELKGLKERIEEAEKSPIKKSGRSPVRSKVQRSGTPIGAVAPQRRDSNSNSRTTSSDEASISMSTPLRSATDSSLPTTPSDATPTAGPSRSRSHSSRPVARSLAQAMQNTSTSSAPIRRTLAGNQPTTPLRSPMNLRNPQLPGDNTDPNRTVDRNDRRNDALPTTPVSSTQSIRHTLDSGSSRDVGPHQALRRSSPLRGSHTRLNVSQRTMAEMNNNPEASPFQTRQRVLRSPPPSQWLHSNNTEDTSNTVQHGARFVWGGINIPVVENSLMFHFLLKRPDFVKNSLSRQRKMMEANFQRAMITEQRYHAAALLAENLIDTEVALPTLRLDTSNIQAFPKTEVRKRTESLYRRTHEFRDKYKENENRIGKAAARIVAHVFSEEVRRKRPGTLYRNNSQ